MFGIRKKKQNDPEILFDPAVQKAVLKCSICNGEQVAGFKDLKTGSFTEVCFIRNNAELEEFKRKYGVKDITKEY